MREKRGKQTPTEVTVFLERQALKRLCSTNLKIDELNRGITRLASYEWREPEHAIVFRAIQRIARTSHAVLRDQLPAQVTRMGFPDMDWRQYFGADAEAPQTASLDELATRLLENAARNP